MLQGLLRHRLEALTIVALTHADQTRVGQIPGVQTPAGQTPGVPILADQTHAVTEAAHHNPPGESFNRILPWQA